MDSSVSLEDRIWFLRVCHHVPFSLYPGGNAGAEEGPLDRSNPSIGSVNSIGGGNRTHIECVRLQTDVSNGRELLLLVDTGADVSLLKPVNLDKSKKFDPDGRIKVKVLMGLLLRLMGL